ncbi:MAG: SDR family NAD(P)-dependent oxidoreductase [Thermoguttaceae bacterium]|nr:SDR family NAD(P)-dependent oxidoreductase [Thermoguttaceae bacterium]
MSNIVIIGASSGIGRELALLYGQNPANNLVLAARREPELHSLAAEIQGQTAIEILNLESPDRTEKIDRLLTHFSTVDLVIYSSGYGEINPELDWELCRKTLDVNVLGFTETVNKVYLYFARQGHGQLAAISSVGGLRGMENDSGYSASKSYILRYMEGLSRKARKEKVSLACTTILPGFVDTQMAKGNKFFWMCSPQTAARQIANGLRKKRRYLYVTKRWRLIAWLLNLMPWWLYERM